MGSGCRVVLALTSGGPPESHPDLLLGVLDGERADAPRPLTKCSENSDDAFAVDELDAAELGARSAGLEEAAGKQPCTDDACGHGPADRRLMVGEDGAVFVHPPANIGGATAHDDVRLAVSPVLQRAAVGEALGQRAAPLPREVPAVVELQRDAEVIVRELSVLG